METCILVTYCLMFVHVTFASSYVTDGFNANITCRASSPLGPIHCTWHTPSDKGCDLFFLLPVPLSNGCEQYLNWTRCRAPLDDEHTCVFQKTTNHRVPSVMPFCSHDLNLKLRCNWSTNVLESGVHYISFPDIVIPNPPRSVTIIEAGQKAMKVAWKKPRGWSANQLHRLLFRLQYWQEVRGTRQNINMMKLNGVLFEQDLRRIISEFDYAFTNSCVRIATRDHSTHLKWSEWSHTVCDKTSTQAPEGCPANLDVLQIGADPKNIKRRINVTWEPMPDEFQGGPILSYKLRVTLVRTGTKAATLYSIPGNTTHRILDDLSCNETYLIEVAVVNRNGTSEYATFTLVASVNPEDAVVLLHRYLYIGFAVLALTIILVLVSAAVVLRRKLRKADLNIQQVKIKEHHTTTCKLNDVVAEKETFDSLYQNGDMNNNAAVETLRKEEIYTRGEHDPLLHPLKDGSVVNTDGHYIQTMPSAIETGPFLIDYSAKVAIPNGVDESANSKQTKLDTKEPYVII